MKGFAAIETIIGAYGLYYYNYNYYHYYYYFDFIHTPTI